MNSVNLGASVQAWKEAVDSWAGSGALKAAVESVLAPGSSTQELGAVLGSIQTNNAAFPSITILDHEGMRGRLGAYSAAQNTIYLSSELAATPSMVSIVLTHELGHAIADRLYGLRGDTAINHVAINRLVIGLIPEAEDIFKAINTATSEPNRSDPSIVLPNGETIATQLFDTRLHIDDEDAVFYAFKSESKYILARAQNHVDDLNFLTNKQSLQFRSAAHFDNNNITGSLEMVRGWYEDGIKNFNAASIQESKWTTGSLPNLVAKAADPVFIEALKSLNIDKLVNLIDDPTLKKVASALKDLSQKVGIDKVLEKFSKEVGETIKPLLEPDPNWLSGLVNPAFSETEPGAADGGIQLLLYRFGQICHALQDFYTHSNWLSLVGEGRNKPLPPNSILDNGLDLPAILKSGDSLSITKDNNKYSVLVATKGADWSKLLQRQGRGGSLIYGGDQDAYWNVNSSKESGGLKDPVLKSRTLNGKEVYGLATGATNELLYFDPDLSINFRDRSNDGNSLKQEYFKGFNHGGMAGTQSFIKNPIDNQNLDRYLGPIAKDSTTSLYNKEARQYANLQIRNEWDRLGNLIFKTYGETGLIKFANFALDWQEDKDKYVATYKQAGGRWVWDDSVSTFTTDLMAPESLGNLGGAELRLINIASRNEARDQVLGLGIQYRLVGGNWTDSAFTDLAAIHYHDDLSATLWQQILTPAASHHTASGGRGYWLEANQESTYGDGVTYVVEDANRDLTIKLDNFDATSDRIIVVDASGNTLATYAGNWNKAEYRDNQQQLQDRYNIEINQAPLALVYRQAWAIEKSQIASANGESTGLALSASTLFADYDQIKSNTTDIFRFFEYDNSVPFLQLTDGKLVATANIGDYVGQRYTALVSVSDGTGVLADQAIDIVVAPTLSLANGTQIKPGQSYAIRFAEQQQGIHALVAGIDLDNELAGLDRFTTLATVTGNATGNPSDWDPLLQIAAIGKSTDSGTLSFWLEDLQSDALSELTLGTGANGSLTLSLADRLIATLTPSDPAQLLPGSVGFEIDSFAVDGAIADVTGFTLTNELNNFKLSYLTNGSANYSSSFGLLMTDARTGDTIDPLTGRLYANRIDNFRDNITSYALFETGIAHNRAATGSVNVQLEASIDVRNIVFTPFIRTNAEGTERLYSGNPLLNSDGIDHVVKLASTIFGIEDMYGGGDRDYNDVIFAIRGITPI